MEGSGSPPAGRLQLVEAYYLATPLFVLADLLFGLPVRAAGIEQPGLRMGYYALAFALGLLCRAQPRLTPFVGMGESALNLTILMASLLGAIYAVPEDVLAGGLPDAGEITDRLVALVLSGSVLVFSFYRHQAAALRQRRGRV